MLYLDYSRKAGEWIPNIYGGNENLEAISFLRKTNELVHQVPGAMTIAEESTAFTGVSRPVYLNGLGFTMKWNMGWMHDMLQLLRARSDLPQVSPERRSHSAWCTRSPRISSCRFRMTKWSTENARCWTRCPATSGSVLPMPARFSSYMYGHPGKKLLFMGSEFGQTAEWNSEEQIEWWLLQFPIHQKLKAFCAALNELYRSEPALYEVDFQYSGFEWIDFHDAENSMVSFVRRAKRRDDYLVFVCNFTPQPHMTYRLGFPEAGVHQEIFNSDAEIFGGSNMGNGGAVNARPEPSHGRPGSAEIVIPPLGTVVFKPARPLPPLPAPTPARSEKDSDS